MYKSSVIDDDTILVSALPNKKLTPEDYDKKFLQAIMNKYSVENVEPHKNPQYSIVTSGTTANNELTITTINSLVSGLNTTLSSVLTANEYVLESILLDAYMGRAYESVYANINTDYKIEYPKLTDEFNEDELNQVKAEIESFNHVINIENFIRESMAGTFREGNYSSYLKLDKDGDQVVSAVIDHYPLELCYPSDYYIGGENLLEFDISKLKTMLQKSYPKTRKTKKAVYFEKLQSEVEANFPEEVVKAYKDGENIVVLNHLNSGYMKINSMGRKFGVSPFFKALKPLVVLNNIENADVADSKTRSKKIIFQKLRKELLGNNGDRKGFAEMQYAHSAATAALKTNFCLYTAPAFVEDVSYVVDNSTNDKSADAVKTYTSKLLTALGISFTDSELSSYSIANISVSQLMKTINSISEQVETILHKYYQVYLDAIGLPPQLAPTIKVMDSELMEWNLKKEFAQFAFSTLNASRETTFNLIGLDLEDERQKRERENEAGFDAVFYPRPTAYNSAGGTTTDPTSGIVDTDSEGNEITNGRPKSSENKEKQAFDETYSQEVRQ